MKHSDTTRARWLLGHRTELKEMGSKRFNSGSAILSWICIDTESRMYETVIQDLQCIMQHLCYCFYARGRLCGRGADAVLNIVLSTALY